MKILILSDLHGSLKHLEAIEAHLKKSDLIVISGDIASGNDQKKNAESILDSLEKYNLPVIAIHGNCDRPEVPALLEERGYSIHGKGRIIGDTGFFGCGGSNPTPLNTPSEYTEEEITEILREGAAMINGCSKKILVSHAPPRSILDRTFFGMRVGSVSVRDFLENHPVDYCICGHIHEAKGIKKQGGALYINSGSFKRGKFAEIDTDSGKSAVYKRTLSGKITTTN